MIQYSALVLLASLLFAGTAHAEPVDNCAGTQGEMNRCTGRVLGGEQAVLDSLYRQILEDTKDPQTVALLRQAQEKWERYALLQCDAEADEYRGGSMENAIRAGCLASLTRARILELQGQSVWFIDLARLLAAAGDDLTETVFWNPTSAVYADLNGDGAFDDAFLGILPGSEPGGAPTVLVAVLLGGTEVTIIQPIPVDGTQEGLCGMNVELRAEYPENERPFLVVDDGECDIFRLHLNDGSETFEILRN